MRFLDMTCKGLLALNRARLKHLCTDRKAYPDDAVNRLRVIGKSFPTHIKFSSHIIRWDYAAGEWSIHLDPYITMQSDYLDDLPIPIFCLLEKL